MEAAYGESEGGGKRSPMQRLSERHEERGIMGVGGMDKFDEDDSDDADDADDISEAEIDAMMQAAAPAPAPPPAPAAAVVGARVQEQGEGVGNAAAVTNGVEVSPSGISRKQRRPEVVGVNCGDSKPGRVVGRRSQVYVPPRRILRLP